MPRFATSLLLLCFCLVTFGSVATHTKTHLPKAGVSHVDTHPKIVFADVNVIEESDIIDQLIPAATVTAANKHDNPAVRTPGTFSIEDPLSSGDAPLYIAIRRLLI